MREELLHFTYLNHYYLYNSMATVDGESVEIIDPGIHNLDSGPDFFNSKVKIGKTLWAGNVEIHLNASEWYDHGHHLNASYDNTVLHIVIKNDGPCYNSKGRKIPTLVVNYPDQLEWNLLNLTNSRSWIPCEYQFNTFDPPDVGIWLSSLLVERLEQKTKLVNELVKQCQGSWEEAYYISIAHSFGLKTNALPFELLAKSIPLKVIGKHKNSIYQIEAILFGQSGLISKIDRRDDYIESIKKEYNYLKKLHSLEPIDGSVWKFMRMRPVSFPTIRIAQFAMLIHKSTALFSKTIEADDIKDILSLFDISTSQYWENHYIFGKESRKTAKRLGDNTISIIAINSIVPFLFAFGVYIGDEKLKEKALRILDSLKAETNSIVKRFMELGVQINTASESQSVIHLKNEYCNTKKCLNCRLGVKLITKSTKQMLT